MEKPSAPRWASRLLAWYCDPLLLEELEGDLAEQFADRLERQPVWQAKLGYGWDVLFLMRRFARRRKSTYNRAIGPIMWKNYLTVTLRNVRRYPVYTFLNLTGLAVGLACVLLVVLYVRHELSYDRFHENAERIYRVAQQQPGNVFLGNDKFAVTPAPIAEALREQAADVETATVFNRWPGYISRTETDFTQEEGLWADAHFFRTFSFDFVQGDRETALAQPGSIVLTTSLARKLFGSDNPVGRTVTFETINPEKTYTVTGVVEDVPAASHVQFQFVASIQSSKNFRESLDEWGNSSWQTFFLLREGGSVAGVEEVIAKLIQEHRGEDFKERPERVPRFYTDPLLDLHLYADAQFGLAEPGNVQYLYLYTAVAVVILLLACANYTNLATARALRRTREVGVRKAVGAHRGQLLAQFLGEALLLTLTALLLAVLLAWLALPTFERLLVRELSFDALLAPTLLLSLIGVLILTAVVAGLYPAFVASRVRPALVLKGQAALSVKGRLMRDTLVVGQYAAAIALVIATLVIWQQMQFVRTTELGFNREQVIALQLRDPNLREKLDPLKAELARLPGVSAVSMTGNLPINVGSSTSISGWEGSTEGDEATIYNLYADADFFEVYQVEFVAGKAPPLNGKADGTSTVVLNETAARRLGWTEAVGKMLPDERGEVVGVVQDFHMHSLHLAIEPLMIQLGSGWAGWVSLRVQTSDLPGLLGQVEDVWGQFSSFPFTYLFLDDAFDAMYEQELKLAEGFRYFALLTLLVASLGLFGIASLMAEQRTKEVGVRKVLGASVPGLVVLLSKDFLKLVGIAFVVAVPVAYFAMQEWLSDFAYRTGLHAGWFALVGGAALLVALLTVSYQTFRVARANPVDVLRYE